LRGKEEVNQNFEIESAGQNFNSTEPIRSHVDTKSGKKVGVHQ